MSEQYLLLKWGTLKGWDFTGNEAALKAARKFQEAGMSHSAMGQRMTSAHVEALCEIIDAIDGPIHEDWNGESLTKEQAKKYVCDYAKARKGSDQ